MRSIFRLLAVSTLVAAPALFAQQASDAHVVPLGQGRTVDLRSIKPNAPVASAAEAPNEIVAWDNGVPYAYDSSGNVRQIGSDKFAYDHAGRLIQATINGVERKYEYDRYGNRKKCLQNQGTDLFGDCQGYSIDSDTNHIDGAAYDPNGAGTVVAYGGHQYSYDALNMMTRNQAGDAREFVYSASDERIAVFSVSARSWLWTVRDRSGRVLREFTSNGGANGTSSFKWAKDYVYRDDKLLATLQPQGTSVSTYHYHLDHLGTPRRITDRNDNRVGFHDYFAYGQEVSGGQQESSHTRIKYTGHERDDLGSLDYMHARYYDGGLGRFLTPDVMGGSPRRPQSWNRYAYGFGNPMRYTDPSGLFGFDFFDWLKRLLDDDGCLGTCPRFYMSIDVHSTWLPLSENEVRILRFINYAAYNNSIMQMQQAMIDDDPVAYSMAYWDVTLMPFQFMDMGGGGGGGSRRMATDVMDDAVPPSGFKGSRGFELSNAPYQSHPAPPRNTAGEVGGVRYSGHAFDQMQNRGIMPSVVKNTMDVGSTSPGNKAGTMLYYDAVNNVTVVYGAGTGQVVSVRWGPP